MRTIIPIILAVASLAAHDLARAEPDQPSIIGFSSVAEALSSLKSRPDVKVTTAKPDGWTIVSEPKIDAQWSFVPEGHYAFPAVVKRILKIDSTGDLRIEMTSLCENTKPNCDRLLDEFTQLNQRIRENVQRQLGGKR